jgi:hypothetical protein
MKIVGVLGGWLVWFGLLAALALAVMDLELWRYALVAAIAGVGLCGVAANVMSKTAGD